MTLEEKWKERYSLAVVRLFEKLNRGIEEVIFTGKVPPIRLPWHPVPYGKCPYCYGYGYDDGGPGSWSCRECDRKGILPGDWKSDEHEPYEVVYKKSEENDYDEDYEE